MQIESGTGNGKLVGITDENRLLTDCVTEPNFLHFNSGEEQAYTWNYEAYDPTALDTVMFLRNDSNIPLHIHHIYFYTDTATVINMHTISNGETPTGTAVTGVNLNRNSGNLAVVTAIQDETGNSSQGTILETKYVAANEDVTLLKENGYEIILGKNDCIAIDIVADAGSTFGHIVGYFHE